MTDRLDLESISLLPEEDNRLKIFLESWSAEANADLHVYVPLKENQE